MVNVLAALCGIFGVLVGGLLFAFFTAWMRNEFKPVLENFRPVTPLRSTQNQPYKVGANYFIRTVTHHLTGKLVRVTSKELVLVDAAWIADDGRFMNCLAEGKPKEVEPFPDGLEVLVGRGALIDAVEWKHKLPREQR